MMSVDYFEDDLAILLDILPDTLQSFINSHPEKENIVEIIMDLGQKPQVRFPLHEERLTALADIDHEDLESITNQIGEFNTDNRAGLERTLHRISAIKNRTGRVLGLTMRVGRTVLGSLSMIEDIIASGKNLLFLGPPGVGKTTMLREAARVLSEKKRVMVVDTSNEIAGEGDVPHKGIGLARRMQVTTPDQQHNVMIEAVENHMPESVIVDEIGTELEAQASRTIAERGVQLLATAHGFTLENLIKNPTLSDLVGGVQAVILGDDQAKLRGTQKTILERKHIPTFDVIIEIQSRYKIAIYSDTKMSVDSFLRGDQIQPEVREYKEGEVLVVQPKEVPVTFDSQASVDPSGEPEIVSIFPFGINKDRVYAGIRAVGAPATVAHSISQADIILTTKSQLKTKVKIGQLMQGRRLPLHVVKRNALSYIAGFLKSYFDLDQSDDFLETEAQEEIRDLCRKVTEEGQMMEASPRNAYLRRLQHTIVDEMGLNSMSVGEDPNRRVRVYPR